MDLKIQWFILFCDWFVLISIYGSDNLKDFGVCTLLLRYAVMIIWGLVTYYTVDLKTNPEYTVAINMVIYCLIDSFILFPLQFIAYIFKYNKNNMKEDALVKTKT
jgi:hypothetical protein